MLTLLPGITLSLEFISSSSNVLTSINTVKKNVYGKTYT